MENSRGIVVKRSREGNKATSTAMDMIQERVNKDTRDIEAVVFVQDESTSKVQAHMGGIEELLVPAVGQDKRRSWKLSESAIGLT